MGHIIKIEIIIGTIKISEAGTTLEMIGIGINMKKKMFQETLRTETGHMTVAEAGIEIILEDSLGTEETVDLEIEVNPCLRIEVEREYVINVENQNIL